MTNASWVIDQRGAHPIRIVQKFHLAVSSLESWYPKCWQEMLVLPSKKADILGSGLTKQVKYSLAISLGKISILMVTFQWC